jgi:UDP-3-O-[3-hydroxymyristoyl] glucosamine N-acyltransferase
MRYTIQEIATSLGAVAVGDTSLKISRLAEPAQAGVDDLALAMSPKYAQSLADGAARAAVLWTDADWEGLGLSAAILPDRPRFAMSGLTRMMDPGQGFAPGIHPSAVIDPSATLAEDVSVGPFTVIGPKAQIGAGSVIGPQCFIGMGAVLGRDAYLRDHVSIGARVRIGDRFIAQPGARIGGDGFSFVTAEPSTVEQTRKSLGDRGDTKAQQWTRIHTLGGVRIGDDVECGMNSTIDAGTIRDTVVGDGTKLDNLVHLGHNDVVGKNCLLCGQVGIAGSVTIGDNVVLGGQVGVSDNIFIGDGVIAGGGTKILSNVPAGRSILGYPATEMTKQIEGYKALRRLPKLIRDFAALKKQVSNPGTED